jgi:hypothetical protein
MIAHLAYHLAFAAARALLDRMHDGEKDAPHSSQPLSSPGPTGSVGPGLGHPGLPAPPACSLKSPAKEQGGR